MGGNILGRGLTIGELLVTYYVREAKVSQMDTVWQHARMFGYREAYLDYVRVYLPPQLAARFKELHEGEEALRRGVATNGDPTTVLIRLPAASRATRPNALDPRAIRGVRAGREQVNPRKLKIDPRAAANVLKVLTEAGVSIDERVSRQDRPTKIPLATGIKLVEAIPIVDDDLSIWDPELVVALINSYKDALEDGIVVYVRSYDASSADRTRGRLGGPEIAILRGNSPQAPSLALLYAGDQPQAPQGWFPTIVMPAGSPAFVFSGE